MTGYQYFFTLSLELHQDGILARQKVKFIKVDFYTFFKYRHFRKFERYCT